MHLINKTSLLFLTIFIFACKKDELPVSLPNKGDIETAAVSMSSNYKYQIYFDLSSKSNKGQNLKTEWDIGISNDLTSNDVILNTSKMMFVSPITTKTFAEIQDTIGFGQLKRTDESRGQSIDLACTGNDLFIVDKGMNENGIQLGIYKFQILQNESDFVTIKCANIDGSNEETKTLTKDSEYNFTFINWNNGIEQKMIEPKKNDWDLIFTQYTFIFYEPEYTPYLVTGCLLNSTNTFAIIVENKTFESLDLAYAESQFFPIKRDAIGYEWKFFNGTIYTINTELIYIIKDQNGFYYKLRFIDFYDENGEKGAPQFEYQQL